MGNRALTTEGLSDATDVPSRLLRVLTLVHPPGGARVVGEKLVVGREPGAGGLTVDHGTVSRRHAQLTCARGSKVVRFEDLGSRNGSFVDGRRAEGAELLAHGSVVRVGDALLVYSEVTLPPGMPLEAPERGRSPAFDAAEHVAMLAARTTEPILITGPTGAGKELLARAIHERSGRRGKLVALNCASLSRELIGSELFGHVRGAFSGATGDRTGLFAAADGGTLLLDEIAEMPLDQQPSLLRVLQERKVRRIGADEEVSVDVRVLAATHQDLEALSERGAFRPDLYARLAGVEVELPGLDERREEILPLFRSFLDGTDAPLTPRAAEALLLHTWPRNIRELRSAASKVKLFAGALESIDLDLLPPEIGRGATQVAPAGADEEPSREALVALLEKHGGNVADVGRALDKHRQQVYRWLRRHRLRPEDFRKK